MISIELTCKLVSVGQVPAHAIHLYFWVSHSVQQGAQPSGSFPPKMKFQDETLKWH
jgi:hypothetical protein